MTKGAVLIANNNAYIDYVKQAVYLAERIHKYLDVPVSIITNSANYLKENFDEYLFDNIIEHQSADNNKRIMFDGEFSQRTINWQNSNRMSAYELSPYDQTLLMDTDYIINNSLLKNVFDTKNDFMLYKNGYDLAQTRTTDEFDRVSDTSIDFYWATVVYFTKCDQNETFFNLVKHIKQEWNYYTRIYRLPSVVYRNDYAFSIALHIMNGFQSGSFAQKLPGKLHYIVDKDLLIKHDGEKMTFCVAKEDRPGEYTLLKTDNLNIHVMNKLSLQREIDKELSHV